SKRISQGSTFVKPYCLFRVSVLLFTLSSAAAEPFQVSRIFIPAQTSLRSRYAHPPPPQPSKHLHLSAVLVFKELAVSRVALQLKRGALYGENPDGQHLLKRNFQPPAKSELARGFRTTSHAQTCVCRPEERVLYRL